MSEPTDEGESGARGDPKTKKRARGDPKTKKLRIEYKSAEDELEEFLVKQYVSLRTVSLPGDVLGDGLCHHAVQLILRTNNKWAYARKDQLALGVSRQRALITAEELSSTPCGCTALCLRRASTPVLARLQANYTRWAGTARAAACVVASTHAPPSPEPRA